jgi:hypothetical protein
MKNIKIKFAVLFSLVVLFGFNTTVHAAAVNIETNVDVPSSCNATDTSGATHSYPPTGSSSYLAICALEAAVNTGDISTIKLSNQYPSLGLFVTTVDDITADPSDQYWALYQNGNYAAVGVTLLSINIGDTITFQLQDFSGNNLGDQVILHIRSIIPPSSGYGPLLENIPTGASTNSGTPISTISPSTITTSTIPTFDTTKALDFLTEQQGTDGSFDGDLYTDWTALALASGNNEPQTIKLTKYLESSKMENPILTDYERRAMSLMALGLNPYDNNGENYIGKIVTSFDGKQFGDATQDNDDIFALIVLQNAGYTQNDPIINSDINFILSKQGSDGSWDSSSVDMTGAAMEALSTFNQVGQVKDALAKAENFLEQSEKADGSWNDNASSTAWAIEGILAQNEKPADWSAKTPDGTIGKTPLDYLATVQDIDGGIKDTDLNTKIWETAYITSALSGKTWNQIMQTFGKQDIPTVILPTNSSSSLDTTTHITNVVSMKETPKKEIAIIVKPENPVIQNTATVLNAITPASTIQTPVQNNNWFVNLLERIF